jgi:hypothetical protein
VPVISVTLDGTDLVFLATVIGAFRVLLALVEHLFNDIDNPPPPGASTRRTSP